MIWWVMTAYIKLRVKGAIYDYLRSLDLLSKSLREIAFPHLLSLDEIFSEGRNHEEVLSSDVENPAEKVLKEDIKEKRKRLKHREQLVLQLFFYEGLPLKAVVQVLGVSVARVSQIKTQAKRFYAMILGLDLAGSEKRYTGFAFFREGKVIVGRVKKDKEILSLVDGFTHIFVDAPLSLPKGRKDIHCRDGPHFRKCDLKLKAMGIRFFPITLGPMRMLTERALRIKAYAEGSGKKVYEVFPGAFYHIFGVGRRDKRAILELYRRLGYKLQNENYTQDELDAVACLITGDFYIKGRACELKGEDGTIIVPCYN